MSTNSKLCWALVDLPSHSGIPSSAAHSDTRQTTWFHTYEISENIASLRFSVLCSHSIGLYSSLWASEYPEGPFPGDQLPRVPFFDTCPCSSFTVSSHCQMVKFQMTLALQRSIHFSYQKLCPMNAELYALSNGIYSSGPRPYIIRLYRLFRDSLH